AAPAVEPDRPPQGDGDHPERRRRQGKDQNGASVSRPGRAGQPAWPGFHHQRFLRRRAGSPRWTPALAAQKTRCGHLARHGRRRDGVPVPGTDAVPRPGTISGVADRPALAAARLSGPGDPFHHRTTTGLSRAEHRLRPHAHGYEFRRRPVELFGAPAWKVVGQLSVVSCQLLGGNAHGVGHMARANFENLAVYRLSEKLADEIWSMVLGWTIFAKDTIGKQLVRAAD